MYYVSNVTLYALVIHTHRVQMYIHVNASAASRTCFAQLQTTPIRQFVTKENEKCKAVMGTLASPLPHIQFANCSK